MKAKIEQHTGIPVVSVTYDGTGGFKNDKIVPYLKYSQTSKNSGNRFHRRKNDDRFSGGKNPLN